MTDRDSGAPAFYDEVDTPGLILDRAKLTRNIRRMAEFAGGGPAKLRPHAKTHKCVEIARRQVAAGAVGICVQKTSEAEPFLAGGIAAKLLPLLPQSGFLAAFNDKAEHAAIAARMPVHVATDPLLGLHGALHLART